MEDTLLKMVLEKLTPSIMTKDPRINAINAKIKLISPLRPSDAVVRPKAKMNQKGSILNLLNPAGLFY